MSHNMKRSAIPTVSEPSFSINMPSIIYMMQVIIEINAIIAIINDKIGMTSPTNNNVPTNDVIRILASAIVVILDL